MSLFVNAIMFASRTIASIVMETPKALKALVKQVQEVLETDGQHDRRIRELNRKAWKCELKALRGERRHGAPKEKTLHPNQMRRLEADILQYERALVAHEMYEQFPSEVSNAAFWAVAG